MDHDSPLNVVEFLADLTAGGEQLALIDGQLHYHAPRGEAQQQRIEVLRAHKDALVAWLAECTERSHTYPLSTGQQGLFQAWRLDPETPIYNLFLVARLQDDVDLDALQRALQWLIERHPVLRTRCRTADDAATGAPLQQIEDGLALALPVREEPDWTAAQVAHWIAQEADRPFDLIEGPVMRTAVLCTGAAAGGARLLHWTLHHIASDFLTQEVLIDDLEGLYRAARAGAPQPPQDPSTAPDSPRALTYRDFVRWEQDSLAADGERLQAYWARILEDWPAAPSLPADLATPAAGGAYRPATFDFSIEPGLTEALRAFCREHQVSLFTALLAAYQVVIARSSGAERFVVTTPTSVRHLAGWERTAGYLINPLCLIADLRDDPTMAALLGRTRAHLAECFEHQLFPYSHVLRLIQAKGAAEAADPPAVGFILDAARRPARAPSLFAETVAIGQRGTPEALSLSVFDMAGALSGQVTYDANRLLPDSIRRLVGMLTTLLGGIIADPDRPVSRLPLLTQAQRAVILERWAAPPTPAQGPGAPAPTAAEVGGLHRQFARQAAATPERIALVQCGDTGADTSIRYGELDALADRIARRLRAEGAGPGAVVGVCLERSIGMVAGLLGILKTGAAYLPLDPAYPPARLEYMLSDSGAALLLTADALLPRLPAADTRVVRLADCAADDADAAAPVPAATLQPEDLAYVIYTSGSTGQPKGVEATYGATWNRLTWMWRTQPFTADEVCAQKTALSFVDSVWEIFGPLLQGVPSIILPDLLVKDVPRLIEALARHEVTRLVLVPSLLRALLEAGEEAGADAGPATGPATGQALGERLPLLRYWVCSGETLPMQLVRRFRDALPEARLINLYGSSEVAADVTWHDATAPAQAAGAPPAQVPIGQPIDGVRCCILDEHLEPVAPGIVGELYIGGDCLARGYRGRPDLTRERFIANPFGPGRLFRTGDRVRWLPLPEAAAGEGGRRPDIEYLGRSDSQVKLRGFRIELGEIEDALREHPAVADAVVLLAEAPAGPRLVAYVAAPTQPPSPADLRRHLSRFLPEYMVPSGFELLERLPLTPNGKVDRRALARLGLSEPASEHATEPPASELERTLAAIWADVLGHEAIGRHDDFFRLGGHSLLATRVIARIQGELGVAVPLRALFDHPTLAELAQQVAAQQGTAATDDDGMDLLL
jgi:amino acid adenylation domain-containing protein